MAIYMQCKGKISGLVKGSVTTAGFEDWIDVATFHWSFNGSKQEGGDPTAGEVVITKHADRASTLMIQSGLTNEVLTDVTFKFTTTMKDKVGVFTSYTLSNAHFTKYEVTAQGDDRSIEMFHVAFQKIQQTYTPIDSRLSGVSPTSVTYDVLSGKT